MLIIAGIIIGVILSVTNNSGKYGYCVALYSGDILYDSFWAEKGEKNRGCLTTSSKRRVYFRRLVL